MKYLRSFLLATMLVFGIGATAGYAEEVNRYSNIAGAITEIPNSVQQELEGYAGACDAKAFNNAFRTGFSSGQIKFYVPGSTTPSQNLSKDIEKYSAGMESIIANMYKRLNSVLTTSGPKSSCPEFSLTSTAAASTSASTSDSGGSAASAATGTASAGAPAGAGLDYDTIRPFREAYDRVSGEGQLDNSLVLDNQHGNTNNFELMLRALGGTLRTVGSLMALVFIVFGGVQMITSSDGAGATSATIGRIGGAATGLIILQAAPLLYDVFASGLGSDFGRGTAADVTGSSWLIRILNDFTVFIMEPIVDLAVGFLPLVLTAVIVYCGFRIIFSGGGDTGKYVSGIISSIIGMIVILVGKVAVLGLWGSQGFAPDTERIAGMVGDIINYLFYVMGPVIIALIIYGGYMAVVNATDDGAVSKAVSIIRYAVIGLAIMLSSYVLVNTFFV